MLGEAVAEPHLRLAAQHIDRRFMIAVEVRPRALARLHCEQVHAELRRAGGLGGDAGGIGQALLAEIGFARADDAAYRLCRGETQYLLVTKEQLTLVFSKSYSILKTVSESTQ